MRRRQRPPLAQRHGLDPARIRLPGHGPWATLGEHLRERLPMIAPERLDAMFRNGEIVDLDGPVTADTPFVPHSAVWFHRDLPHEMPVPFDIPIVHRDDDLLVVDKPPFLSTIPRGKHVLQTALVRLRHELGLPELSPAHRLDRMTSGLLMFVIRPELRGAYQTLFARRRVHKEYEAVASVDPNLQLPRTVRSRIVKERGVLTAEEVPGEPNSETYVELLEQRDGLGRYRLLPHTGRTHQLRVHLNSLGVPILGDTFYPEVHERALDDFTRPLQLRSAVLEFRDPLSGLTRRFEADTTLQAWTDYSAWAG